MGTVLRPRFRTAVTVVCAHRYRIVNAAVAQALGKTDDLVLVGAATTAAEVAPLVRSSSPDVALVDADLPGGGLVVVRRLRRRHPDVQVILLGRSTDAGAVEAAFRHGASGYVAHDIEADDLADLIRLVASTSDALGAVG